MGDRVPRVLLRRRPPRRRLRSRHRCPVPPLLNPTDPQGNASGRTQSGRRAAALALLREIGGWEGAASASLPRRLATALARRRQVGSRDRRTLREVAFAASRIAPWPSLVATAAGDDDALDAVLLATDSPATSSLRDEVIARRRLPPGTPLLTALAAAWPSVTFRPDHLLPAWWVADCPGAVTGTRPLDLLSRPPVWIRVRPGRGGAVTAELSRAGLTVTPHPALEAAFRLDGTIDLTRTTAFGFGWFEVQDVGSQWILSLLGARPGESWLDACAGAGGKALGLSDLVGPAGRVAARDIRREALGELATRARRASATNLGAALVDGAGGHHPVPGLPPPAPGPYDGVLVDAPCSGSGTWRRHPHLRFALTPAEVAAQVRRQEALLAAAAAEVRTGGTLAYATCSLGRAENEGVTTAFLASHPGFVPTPPQDPIGAESAGDGLRLWPWVHDGDGFFLALFRRVA